ncbi:MAG TPA: hypothetical protein P5048_00040 [Chlamydiales bacterium]|nr:hypothetical protein [Chlamydiales bacterium]
MTDPASPDKISDLHFNKIIGAYAELQEQLVKDMNSLSTKSGVAPQKFLLLQFKMSQVTQVGDTISNLISQVNSVVNNAVRNQKSA